MRVSYLTSKEKNLHLRICNSNCSEVSTIVGATGEFQENRAKLQPQQFLVSRRFSLCNLLMKTARLECSALVFSGKFSHKELGVRAEASCQRGTWTSGPGESRLTTGVDLDTTLWQELGLVDTWGGLIA